MQNLSLSVLSNVHNNCQGPDGAVVMEAPGGYAFYIYDRNTGRNGRHAKNLIHMILIKNNILKLHV